MALRTYTFHVPEVAARGDARALDRAQVVADGFSWPAFAFSLLWFLRHRLWLAALIVAVGLAGLAVLGRLLGLSPFSGLVVTLLASVLIGLEASSLRRWSYGRDGRPARDAVIAETADEAEAKAIARWLDAGADPAGRGPATPARRADEPVIGLFPLSEAGR